MTLTPRSSPAASHAGTSMPILHEPASVGCTRAPSPTGVPRRVAAASTIRRTSATNAVSVAAFSAAATMGIRNSHDGNSEK